MDPTDHAVKGFYCSLQYLCLTEASTRYFFSKLVKLYVFVLDTV